MSQLFRKEALERRSRALFGEVRLRAPLSALWTLGLVALTLGVLGWMMFGMSVNGQSVWAWLRG